MALGGSTNAVLHLIAIAHSVGLELKLDEFQDVSDRIPFLADLRPSGKYVMEDVNRIGGIPSKSPDNPMSRLQLYLSTSLHLRCHGIPHQGGTDDW